MLVCRSLGRIPIMPCARTFVCYALHKVIRYASLPFCVRSILDSMHALRRRITTPPLPPTIKAITPPYIRAHARGISICLIISTLIYPFFCMQNRVELSTFK